MLLHPIRLQSYQCYNVAPIISSQQSTSIRFMLMPILIEHTDHNVCEKFFAALSIETGKENRLDWHRTEVKIVRLFINKNNSCKESLIASSRTCLVSRTFDLHCVELTTIGKPQASPNNYLLEKMFWTITTLNYFNWTRPSTTITHVL